MPSVLYCPSRPLSLSAAHSPGHHSCTALSHRCARSPPSAFPSHHTPGCCEARPGIKNVIWQAERGLGQETPVESLLTQYHDARAQKQNTDALEKQINERLEGVLSRWLLLKNNVMPEAATGTTAEK